MRKTIFDWSQTAFPSATKMTVTYDWYRNELPFHWCPICNKVALFIHRNVTFYSENIWSNVKKYSPLYIKKHKGCNASIILRYTKMPYPPKTTNKKKSDHNFIYHSDRKHKNVPVKIVSPLVNAFPTEIFLIFYCLFQIFRPSRKPFGDVTFVDPQWILWISSR